MTFSSSSGGDRGLTLARALALTVLALSLALTPVAADFSGPDWRYAKAITLPVQLGPEGLAELSPDPEVYAGAAPGLADLRIVEDGGAEVPYQLTVAAASRSRQAFPATVRDLGHLPGQYTSFVADLGQPGQLHNQVEIATSSQNFQREVTVEGGNDGSAWAVLQPGTKIFDFTVRERGFTTRNTRVAYPESTMRYLRVRIANGGEAPLEVTGATVYAAKETPARQTVYGTVITGRTEDGAYRLSRLVIDLGSPGLPTNTLTIQTPQVNFYRGVNLEAGDDGLVWSRLLASDVVYAYDTPKFTGSQLAVSYPETTASYLRLTIVNGDDPPLPVAGVTVRGVARRIIFQAQPGAVYTLYYGNAAARAPSYELARILPYLETGDLPVARLGPQQSNQKFSIPEPPLSERLPWLIPGAVALAAVVVVLLLVGVLRQAKKLLPPPA